MPSYKYPVSTDLQRAPRPIPYDIFPTDQITFGDLHGNAIKLIHLLVQNKLMVLNNGQYEELNHIYNTPTDELTVDLVNRFKAIVDDATYNPIGLIRLLGDELADRGNNDYFTLLILQALSEHKIPFTITLSNHSVVALMQFDNLETRGNQYIGDADKHKDQQRSSHNMWKLLNKPEFHSHLKYLQHIANQTYKPRLKLIDYCVVESEGKKTLTLFTHAPVGLETVKSLASDFQLPYDDSTIENLTYCIDKINKIASQHIADGSFTIVHFNPAENLLNLQSLERLFWARSLCVDFTLQPKGNFNILEVHGHIGETTEIDIRDLQRWYKFHNDDELNKTVVNQNAQLAALVNLDNNLGKGIGLQKGIYQVVVQEDLNIALKNLMQYKTSIANSLNQIMDINENQFRALQLKIYKQLEEAYSLETIQEIAKNIDWMQKSIQSLQNFDVTYSMDADDQLMQNFIELFKQKILNTESAHQRKSIQDEINGLITSYDENKNKWIEIFLPENNTAEINQQSEELMLLIKNLPIESRNLIWEASKTTDEMINAIRNKLKILNPQNYPLKDTTPVVKQFAEKYRKTIQQGEDEENSDRVNLTNDPSI